MMDHKLLLWEKWKVDKQWILASYSIATQHIVSYEKSKWTNNNENKLCAEDWMLHVKCAIIKQQSAFKSLKFVQYLNVFERISLKWNVAVGMLSHCVEEILYLFADPDQVNKLINQPPKNAFSLFTFLSSVVWNSRLMYDNVMKNENTNDYRLWFLLFDRLRWTVDKMLRHLFIFILFSLYFFPILCINSFGMVFIFI